MAGLLRDREGGGEVEVTLELWVNENEKEGPCLAKELFPVWMSVMGN
jgi:hypothetical protein